VKGPLAERPRVPVQRFSRQVESTPKARPKGVVDGQRVNIPVLVVAAKGGRRELGYPGVGNPRGGTWFKRIGGVCRKIRTFVNTEALRRGF
jgi:hypothetical protein